MTRTKLLSAVVAVIVAGIVAWLVWGTGTSGTAVQQAVSGPYTVRLDTGEARIGANSFTFDVTPAPTGVSVEPVMAQMGHALAPVPAGPDGAGHFRADGIELPMSGQWELAVTLNGPGGPFRTVFPLLVK
ncbi:MAG TPA: hypothetical protein VJX66_28660 [Amycolatopsis sp.]|nr:hypothetical protein [Amycolatopsis sp.]